VGTLYMTLEGIFGVPLNVASSYVVLFTSVGGMLQHSGAGQFFITWTMSAFGRSSSGAGPGRTVTMSGFLLGTVSGSGVATTVTLGAVAWPMLRRAGFSPEIGGGILSASGIGAILAPPTMGAAAFLIAEFLQITYLQVIAMAIVPAVLYYLSIVLMIEADARRLGTKAVDVDVPSVWTLTRQSGYQFLPLIAIVLFLATVGANPAVMDPLLDRLEAIRAAHHDRVMAVSLIIDDERRQNRQHVSRRNAAVSAGAAVLRVLLQDEVELLQGAAVMRPLAVNHAEAAARVQVQRVLVQSREEGVGGNVEIAGRHITQALRVFRFPG